MSTLFVITDDATDPQGRKGPRPISPNGTRLASIANDKAAQSIWIRMLDATKAKPLRGTEDA
jgi:hypothetical protein